VRGHLLNVAVCTRRFRYRLQDFFHLRSAAVQVIVRCVSPRLSDSLKREARFSSFVGTIGSRSAWAYIQAVQLNHYFINEMDSEDATREQNGKLCCFGALAPCGPRDYIKNKYNPFSGQTLYKATKRGYIAFMFMFLSLFCVSVFRFTGTFLRLKV